MAHNFYSTNFTHLRVISLGRKHVTPGSEWGMGTCSSVERDGKISTVRNQSGWHISWDSVFTGIQNASEKPPVSKSQRETGQAAKNVITKMDLSTFLVPVFMSTRTPCSLTY